MTESIISIDNKISLDTLKEMAEASFGDMVKAVVDIEKELMQIGEELHADEEKILLENGSLQENLWGINIYPFNAVNEWIEFDSMINIRPRQNNRSRNVEDAGTREKIISIVQNLITT